MRLLLLLLSFFWSMVLHAQNDSVRIFQKKLKQRDLSDSIIGYYNAKIGNYLLDSNPGQALQYFSKAFFIGNKIWSNTLQYSSSNGIATIYYDKGIFDSSIFYAKISYEVAQRIHDIPLLYTAQKLIGNLYMEKLQRPQAKMYYDDALKIVTTDISIPHRSLIYLDLGNYYFKSFNFQKALEVLKIGDVIVDKSKELDDRMQIFTSLGLTYAYIGKADSVQYYLFEALNYFHQNHKLKYEALVNQKLGIAYGLFNNTSKMEQYLDIAYNQLLTTGNIKGAINTRMLKANNYFKSYQFDKCLQVANATEPVAQKYNEKPGLALCYIYKAGILSLVGDSINSKIYQSEAERLNQEINNPIFNQMNMLIKAITISARLKINMGDSVTREVMRSVKAIVPGILLKSTLESISINRQLVDSNQKDFHNVYQSVLIHDNPQYSSSYESFIGKRIDSTISVVFNQQLVEMETRYKTKEKVDSIIAQTYVIKLQKDSISMRNSLLIVLFVLAVLILFLFLRSRVQSKKISHQLNNIQQLQAELTHRTGNFFNSINGMMAIALINTNDKSTVLALQKRVNTINHLYGTLYSSSDNNQSSFTTLLASLCNDFEHSFDTVKQIKIYQECNAQITRDEVLPLAFIITELVTNSIKHAFKETPYPEIHIKVGKTGNKRMLHVWDNGNGQAESVKPRNGSQGMGIIKNYSKNLRGNFTTWNNDGFHFKMEF